MMKKYGMKCTCGHDMTVEANTLEEAHEKMKMMMDQAGIDKHWAENHKDDDMKMMPKPSKMEVDKMIMETVHEMTGMPEAPMKM